MWEYNIITREFTLTKREETILGHYDKPIAGFKPIAFKIAAGDFLTWFSTKSWELNYG